MKKRVRRGGVRSKRWRKEEYHLEVEPSCIELDPWDVEDVSCGHAGGPVGCCWSGRGLQPRWTFL